MAAIKLPLVHKLVIKSPLGPVLASLPQSVKLVQEIRDSRACFHNKLLWQWNGMCELIESFYIITCTVVMSMCVKRLVLVLITHPYSCYFLRVNKNREKPETDPLQVRVSSISELLIDNPNIGKGPGTGQKIVFRWVDELTSTRIATDVDLISHRRAALIWLSSEFSNIIFVLFALGRPTSHNQYLHFIYLPSVFYCDFFC